ncbi:MAG: 5-dehydro-4-deoxy-D-glucuronate isomerase [Clostridiales bacterium]|nr:5-dehydro-4-deoxy-D-glucuronate isomerase [Clostridiales bacterium]HOK81941.1 5-dehydro-4-deoxy-D-glucuronate isomerase [Clostridia bacterium]HOL61245.1 5-dehydro-4-deoxy-D-glucuronate isomerase [Clostridia bacterium]HPO53923.1 5-dehydro-4-deoxy-D-glucuronate isomerase [Clostridia bacterium]
MNIRYAVSKKEFSRMNTEELRQNFLIESPFITDTINLTYSHYDRIIAGGALPVMQKLKLKAGEELGAEYFLQRREMGIINIGGSGVVTADGTEYKMKKYDCLYLGRGVKDVTFSSDDPENPAYFYINSTPAHKEYPSKFIPLEEAVHLQLGSQKECNRRVINKYIIPQTVPTCQLTMGLTILEEGSNWNTMPTHTHERRMEVYLYFDIPQDNVVFHMMGNPTETRHIVVQNKQAVISPSWSIHSGVGTQNYSFIWGMCGENQEFDDMQGVKTTDLR